MATKPGIQRTQDFSPEEIRELIKRLRKVASALTAVAATMEEQEIDQISVQGGAMVERGFDSFAKFVGNCEKELRDF